jgi:oligoribonuclease
MSKASLLWMDLEMTGLDVNRDRILEIGAIATDWKLNEIARFVAVVKVSPRLMKRRMVGEFWDKNPAVRDSLIQQNCTGRSARAVEDDLIKFVKSNFKIKQPIYLAGNSVWNDRQFMEREWPRLIGMLHYRMLDVTAWKIVFENMFAVTFAKTKGHRAVSDIEGSVAELKQYLGKSNK